MPSTTGAHVCWQSTLLSHGWGALSLPQPTAANAPLWQRAAGAAGRTRRVAASQQLGQDVVLVLAVLGECSGGGMGGLRNAMNVAGLRAVTQAGAGASCGIRLPPAQLLLPSTLQPLGSHLPAASTFTLSP